MFRVLAGLCIIGVLGAVLSYAGDAPSSPPTASPPEGVTYPSTNQPQETSLSSYTSNAATPKPGDSRKSPSIRNKREVESLLRSAADVEFGGRPKVTIKEVFDALHQKHQLSIRFDLPTLAVLFGGDASYNLDALESEKPEKPSTDTPVSVVPVQQEQSSRSSEEELPLMVFLTRAEVSIEYIDTKRVQIATLIRHALEAVPSTSEITAELAGIPLRPYNADLIDYLVEEDGILLTSRMNALTVKETRVYAIKNLSGLTTEQLATVIRQSVRPWSWRSHINDLGEQITKGLPQQLPQQISSVLSTGMQIASATAGVGLTPIDSTNATCQSGCCAPPTATAQIPAYAAVEPSVASAVQTSPLQFAPSAADATVAVKFLVNGLVTTAQATLSALEMVHFSEVPTGTIHALPNALVITQSQAAHREIAGVLADLGMPSD